MTAQLPSKDTLQKIIETANEIITVNNGTNEDIWENDTATITRLYDQLNDDLANPSVVKALAEFALAAHEQEPVGTLFVKKTTYNDREIGNHFAFMHADCAMKMSAGQYPLYTNPAPVPAVPDEQALSDLRERLADVVGVRSSNDDDVLAIFNACRAAMLNGGKS